jgi:hypothetical protein
MKYYQKRNVMNDCLARGFLVLQSRNIKETTGIGQNNLKTEKKLFIISPRP